MPTIGMAEGGIIGLAVIVVARELFSLIRWLIERRNGGPKAQTGNCSAGVEIALNKLTEIQKGQQQRLDKMDAAQHERMNRLEDGLNAIQAGNRQMVMEVITLLQGARAGGP